MSYQKIGLGGLGWSDVAGQPTCPDYPGYMQRCFTTEAVNGRPAEQDFARAQGCVAMERPCSTSPGNNPGSIWCCAAGWPRAPSAAELKEGESEVPPTPPPPPGFQRWVREWWFWGIVGGVGAIAFFGWQTWKYANERTVAEELGLLD